jgi:hypothetical protein
MSTIILGRLANPSQPTWGQAVDAAGGDDGKKHWAEALAAVIPGEAIAAYSAVAAFFTVKGAEAALDTEEPAAAFNHEWWVFGLSVAILLAIPIVYAGSAGVWYHRRHALRWGMAMAAFPVWLWLLPLSPWDSVLDLDGVVRAGVGIVAALVVVSLANYLFKRWPLPG